ncbi:TPA: microviridin/marinostatin family tricyclic proteinase inhibitor [Vibrio vulnificus]|nr:microviridin/marinostatin family tricyclic proteinase inhibitor [Vibrio vulnificus]
MSNTPFFANFIESQVEELSTEELQQCAGGAFVTLPGDFEPPVDVTMKAPSDDDEGIEFGDLFQIGTCPGINPAQNG